MDIKPRLLNSHENIPYYIYGAVRNLLRRPLWRINVLLLFIMYYHVSTVLMRVAFGDYKKECFHRFVVKALLLFICKFYLF